MITKTNVLCADIFFPEDFFGPKDEVLFFDIETTGFISAKSDLYLIGASFFQNGCWQLIQWLAESPGEEPLLLKTFQEFAASFTTLVHFNGDTFDLPFLFRKAKKHHLEPFLDWIRSADLLRLLRPVKKLLGLTRMNQTALEEYLEIERKDTYTGGELVTVFQSYIKNPDPKLAGLLLLHNHDDILGMLSLLPLLAYTQLLNGQFQAKCCDLDQEDATSFSVIFRLTLPDPVPKPLSRKLDSGYLHVSRCQAKLLVYGIKGTLKHFFPNYHDYYYLPLEDTAVHKSVGAYVAREHRIQAKAATCYCKKTGAFLPAPALDIFADFRETYSASTSFLECTSEFINHRSALQKYCAGFLQEQTAKL